MCMTSFSFAAPICANTVLFPPPNPPALAPCPYHAIALRMVSNNAMCPPSDVHAMPVRSGPPMARHPTQHRCPGPSGPATDPMVHCPAVHLPSAPWSMLHLPSASTSRSIESGPNSTRPQSQSLIPARQNGKHSSTSSHHFLYSIRLTRQ